MGKGTNLARVMEVTGGSLAVEGGAVGLVTGAFEDDRELGLFLLQGGKFLCHRAAHCLVFQRAGSGDQKEFTGVKDCHEGNNVSQRTDQWQKEF